MKNMSRLSYTTALLTFAVGLATPAIASTEMDKSGSSPVTVGGAPMYPNKNIVENASKSADHTTLVTAVKAAGLADTLQGAGPYTVFAPTNAAFAKLPSGTVENLLKPENKEKLASILTYHVVPGRLTATDLKAKAEANGGKAMLKTVEGEDLTVSAGPNNSWIVADAKGDMATITKANVAQSNGTIHVIDTVLMP